MQKDEDTKEKREKLYHNGRDFAANKEKARRERTRHEKGKADGGGTWYGGDSGDDGMRGER